MKKYFTTMLLNLLLLLSPQVSAQNNITKSDFISKLKQKSLYLYNMPAIHSKNKPVYPLENKLLNKTAENDFTSELIKFPINSTLSSVKGYLPIKFKYLMEIYANVSALGVLDNFIKGNIQAKDPNFDDFWKAQGPFGHIMITLQAYSALSYGLSYNGSWLDKARMIIAQSLISNLGEHLAYWRLNTNGVPIKEWRGPNTRNIFSSFAYPKDPNSNNDVPWMEGTAAGYWSKYVSKHYPSVSEQDVLCSFALVNALAYAILPSKEIKKSKEPFSMHIRPYFDYDGISNPATITKHLRTAIEIKLPHLEMILYNNHNGNPSSTINFNIKNGYQFQLNIETNNDFGLSNILLNTSYLNPITKKFGIAAGMGYSHETRLNTGIRASYEF